MTQPQSPFEDDFGPDLVNRINRKILNTYQSGADPSYDDALHIVRQWVKKTNLSQDNKQVSEELVSLARSLTQLRYAAGILSGGDRMWGAIEEGGISISIGSKSQASPEDALNVRPENDHTLVKQAVQDSIDHLTNESPNISTLEALSQTIAGGEYDIRYAFEKVCAHESVRIILSGDIAQGKE